MAVRVESSIYKKGGEVGILYKTLAYKMLSALKVRVYEYRIERRVSKR